jgi:hypothetical protein
LIKIQVRSDEAITFHVHGHVHVPVHVYFHDHVHVHIHIIDCTVQYRTITCISTWISTCIVLDLVSQVRDVVLMNVYLDLGDPGGSGFWNEGYMYG